MWYQRQKKHPRYLTIEKFVGETPLMATNRLRLQYNIQSNVPLAYAGRLDPMASGKLLILVGDECKKQEKYHAFDKEYHVEVLLGVTSDTGDVLGLLKTSTQKKITTSEFIQILRKYTGCIELPYPHFSSKTVRGKPLHVWTLEGRLQEIEIPTKKSRVYIFADVSLKTISKEDLVNVACAKIETIPTVVDPKKVIGADFRRVEVRNMWNTLLKDGYKTYQIFSFRCIASSGTYMRSLSTQIAEDLGTCGLAYSIHRTKIGTYIPIFKTKGVWISTF